MKYSHRDRVHRGAYPQTVGVLAQTARTADHRRMVATAAMAAALAVGLAVPPTAHAGWPLGSAAPVSLGFGATYAAADGSSVTHRGADVAAAEGSTVISPIVGRVSFVGRVPGQSGGTVLAMTIAGEGGSVTLLPLASARVVVGAQLAEGDAIGALAGVGDESTQPSHLHVGARRGDLYIDPLSLICAPRALPEDVPEPPSAVAAAQDQPANAGVPATAGSADEVAPAVRVSSSPAAVPEAAQAPAVAAGAPMIAPVPGAAVAPGVSLADGSAGGAAEGPMAAADALSARLSTVRGSSCASASLGGLSSWARSIAARGLWTGARLLLAFLSAIGALWPVWRKERGKGEGQILVRPGSDDVAVVANQW